MDDIAATEITAMPNGADLREVRSAVAMIERLRADMHQKIDEQINRSLYHIVTQRDAGEMNDGIASLGSDTAFLKGRKPVSVIFADGREVQAKKWKDVAKSILQDCDRDPKMHDEMMFLRQRVAGRERFLLCDDPCVMDTPIRINDKLYFESYFDTETLLHHMKRILTIVGYDCNGILLRYHDPQREESLEEASQDDNTKTHRQASAKRKEER